MPSQAMDVDAPETARTEGLPAVMESSGLFTQNWHPAGVKLVPMTNRYAEPMDVDVPTIETAVDKRKIEKKAPVATGGKIHVSTTKTVADKRKPAMRTPVIPGGKVDVDVPSSESAADKNKTEMMVPVLAGGRLTRSGSRKSELQIVLEKAPVTTPPTPKAAPTPPQMSTPTLVTDDRNVKLTVKRKSNSSVKSKSSIKKKTRR